MKVYVTTMAEPFKSEVLMDVYSSRKAAEKALRGAFPYMRKTDDPDCFMSDNRKALLLFIHEKEVQ